MFKKSKKSCSLVILSFVMIFQNFNLVVDATRKVIPESTLKQMVSNISTYIRLASPKNNKKVAIICETIAKYHANGYIERLRFTSFKMRRHIEFSFLNWLIETIKTAQWQQEKSYFALAAINHEQIAIDFCDMAKTPIEDSSFMSEINEWLNENVSDCYLIDRLLGGKVYKSIPIFTRNSAGYRCFSANEFLEAAILWAQAGCPNTAAQAYYTACRIINSDFIKLDPKKEDLFLRCGIIPTVQKQMLDDNIKIKKGDIPTYAAQIMAEAKVILQS